MTETELIDMLDAGPDGCGAVAFRMTYRPHPGDQIMARHVVLVDGTTPAPMAPIACGSCHRLIRDPSHIRPAGGWD